MIMFAKPLINPVAMLLPRNGEAIKITRPIFRPVSKEQFLAKILARFRRERHLVRRPAENLHPKLIAAVGKKQPADATTHAVSDYHHRFEFRKLLLHLIEFLAQDRRRIRKWITGRVTV